MITLTQLPRGFIPRDRHHQGRPRASLFCVKALHHVRPAVDKPLYPHLCNDGILQLFRIHLPGHVHDRILEGEVKCARAYDFFLRMCLLLQGSGSVKIGKQLKLLPGNQALQVHILGGRLIVHDFDVKTFCSFVFTLIDAVDFPVQPHPPSPRKAVDPDTAVLHRAKGKLEHGRLKCPRGDLALKGPHRPDQDLLTPRKDSLRAPGIRIQLPPMFISQRFLEAFPGKRIPSLIRDFPPSLPRRGILQLPGKELHRAVQQVSDVEGADRKGLPFLQLQPVIREMAERACGKFLQPGNAPPQDLAV